MINSNISFQEPVTLAMEGIFALNQIIMIYLIIVVLFVGYFLLNILIDFYYYVYNFNKDLDTNIPIEFFETYNNVTHNTNLEIGWTLTPTFILLTISIPSFYLLFLMDESYFNTYTLKAIGHQWYWSYEIGGLDIHEDGRISSVAEQPIYLRTTKLGQYQIFDSYLIDEADLIFGDFRLLEVTEYPVIPLDTTFALLVTATDVLHSFALPSFGIKIDAVPGRLNQVSVMPIQTGTFYGQCSELCGVGHGFMPITVQVVEPEPLDYATNFWKRLFLILKDIKVQVTNW